MNNQICIFASSSNAVAKEYFHDAFDLSVLLAKEGYDLVFGGGTIGLMGECARAFKKNKRRVISVIPEKLNKKGIVFDESDEIIETESMSERKFIMDKISSAFISLAGGFGTIEELMEVITLKQLGYNNKPIIIFNTNDFYKHLILQLEELYKQNFTKRVFENTYFVTSDPDEAVSYLKSYKAKSFEEKFY